MIMIQALPNINKLQLLRCNLTKSKTICLLGYKYKGNFDLFSSHNIKVIFTIIMVIIK